MGRPRRHLSVCLPVALSVCLSVCPVCQLAWTTCCWLLPWRHLVDSFFPCTHRTWASTWTWTRKDNLVFIAGCKGFRRLLPLPLPFHASRHLRSSSTHGGFISYAWHVCFLNGVLQLYRYLLSLHFPLYLLPFHFDLTHSLFVLIYWCAAYHVTCAS